MINDGRQMGEVIIIIINEETINYIRCSDSTEAVVICVSL